MCRSKNAGVAGYAEAFRPVQSYIIFDAGIGDLFTVRTAGQVIDDAVIASLEYAVDVLGSAINADIAS